MAKFNERLRELRNSRGLSQQLFADKIGLSKSSINMYERGEREPGIDTLEAIADFFNVDLDYLTGKSDIITRNTLSVPNIFPISRQRIPLLGSIACGEPIYAAEDRESYIECGTNIKADFCLRAEGDSMTGARIQDGDIVFIRSQPIVDNGEIAAVLIDDSATLKRVYYDRKAQKLVLNAENPKYAPLVYIGEELEQVRILGKAIAFQSDVI